MSFAWPGARLPRALGGCARPHVQGAPGRALALDRLALTTGALAFTPLALALGLLAFASGTSGGQPASAAPPARRAGPALTPFYEMSDAEVAATLRRIHERNPTFGARVAALSARFLGTPYKFNPLGEGPGAPLDRDPTFSVQHVDCLTFLEEVAAMAHAPDLATAKRLLQHIRYAGGRIDFAFRHHFAESQWLPANQRLGLLREITRDLGGDAVVDETKRLSPATFTRAWAKWKTQLGQRLPRGEFTLPVLPIADALRLWTRFPAGAIVTVVRVDRPGVPTRITHQGLVVVKHGKRYLRHASGPPFKRVIDFSLDAYFRFCMRYFKHRWPVFGVNVQQLTQSAALLGAARAATSEN